jgi:hypothetical protein
MSNRPTFTVELQDGTTHTVGVVLGDQLRAELEAPRHGIPTDPAKSPLHTATLWVWAAMARHGFTALGFQAFQAECVAIARATEDQLVPVDPTGPDQPTA